MADVKWIKMTTDMFDNRKIKHLRRLPEGNNVVLIWVMLLTMAGRCNAGGWIYLTEDIPYTPKMLADELGFEESTVQLALRALEQLGMIVFKDDYFAIAGWENHQNIESLEYAKRVREQSRIRKQKQREKEKLLIEEKKHDTVQQTDEEQEEYTDDEAVETVDNEEHEEFEKVPEALGISEVSDSDNVVTPMSRDSHVKSRLQNKNKKENKNIIINYQEIINLYNNTCVSFPRVRPPISESRKKAIKARMRVYTIDEFRRMFEMAERSDFLKGSNGRDWSANFDWMIKDTNMAKILEGNYENRQKNNDGGEAGKNKFNNFKSNQNYDMAEIEKQLEESFMNN